MEKVKSYKGISVGEIVANDFRTAEVFKAAGIDFCCGGKKSMMDACREKSIDPALLEEQLAKLENSPLNQAQNYREWDPGFLSDYIVNTHHNYVRKSLPELLSYTQKTASVHGTHHPELIEVAQIFQEINDELAQHLDKEEQVLFPAIKEVLKSNSNIDRTVIKSEIKRMSAEHEFAGGAMDKINAMTSNYQVPSDGCNTYQVTFKLLKQFEDDLHTHVHLENNILYPKALSL